MSASRQKGTGGERELARKLEASGFTVIRREFGARTDLRIPGVVGDLFVLATRPDRGDWLFTVDYDTFVDLAAPYPASFDLEVKRWKQFAHHSLFRDEKPA